MPKLIETTKTDYDFHLVYRRPQSPFEVGAKLQSPICDDNGQTIKFTGAAIVVLVKDHFMSKGNRLQDIYVKQFPSVEP